MRRFSGAGFEAGWIGVFGWLAICLTILALHATFLVFPSSYRILSEEDNLVENLTAVAYPLAGALLFAAAWAEKRRFPRFAFLVGGVAMVFIFGEEITWGQRILGFATPDFLSSNMKGEATVHNLPRGPTTVFLESSFHLVTMLLCLTTAAALFSRKRSLFGVPLPSLPLLLALLSIPWGKIPPWGMGWYLMDGRALDFWFALFERWKIAVLVLLAAWALFSKRSALVLAAAASLVLAFSAFYVDWLNTHYSTETRELTQGLFWLCYAGELLRGVRRRAAAPASLPQRPQANEAESFPLLPAVSWVALAGGAGLLALAHFNVWMERSGIEAALRAARLTDPDIRAEFDLYLTDGQLTYFKEPCDRAAWRQKFFLHIFPEDEADLPTLRKQHGFDNLDFLFFRRGMRIRGSCVAVASLPDYPIVSIRTGQFDEGRELWSARLLVAE